MHFVWRVLISIFNANVWFISDFATQLFCILNVKFLSTTTPPPLPPLRDQMDKPHVLPVRVSENFESRSTISSSLHGS